eukprot:COSAG06_NODE_61371_length_268_cov_0.550296_1_plen_63_part_01
MKGKGTNVLCGVLHLAGDGSPVERFICGEQGGGGGPAGGGGGGGGEKGVAWTAVGSRVSHLGQ